MSASSPTTRIVPPATAFVNGDSRGSKNRRYGSSDVLENRSVSSASICGGQRDAAGAGHHQTGRGGLELDGQQLAAQRETAGELADAFVAGEQIVDAHADVVAGLVERAGAAGRELQQAGQRRAGERRRLQRLDRNSRAVGVEGVGAVPADPRRAGHASGALCDLERVQPDARALEAQRRVGRVEGLAVGGAVDR